MPHLIRNLLALRVAYHHTGHFHRHYRHHLPESKKSLNHDGIKLWPLGDDCEANALDLRSNGQAFCEHLGSTMYIFDWLVKAFHSNTSIRHSMSRYGKLLQISSPVYN